MSFRRYSNYRSYSNYSRNNYAPRPNGGIDAVIERRMQELYYPVYIAGTTYVLGYQSRYDPCTIISVKGWWSAARSLMKSHSKGFGYKESLPHKHIKEGRIIDLRSNSDLADVMMEALNNTTNPYLVYIIAYMSVLWEGNMPYFANFERNRTETAPVADVSLPVSTPRIITPTELPNVLETVRDNSDSNRRSGLFSIFLQMLNPIKETITRNSGRVEVVYPTPIDGKLYQVFNDELASLHLEVSKYYEMTDRAAVMATYQMIIGNPAELERTHYDAEAIQFYDMHRAGEQVNRPGAASAADMRRMSDARRD